MTGSSSSGSRTVAKRRKYRRLSWRHTVGPGAVVDPSSHRDVLGAPASPASAGSWNSAGTSMS